MKQRNVKKSKEAPQVVAYFCLIMVCLESLAVGCTTNIIQHSCLIVEFWMNNWLHASGNNGREV